MKRAGVTPSQLDLIAEVNVRVARQQPGRQTLWVAFTGGAVLLGVALWWSMQRGAARAPAPPPPAAAVPAETLRDAPAAAAQASPAASEAAVPAVPDPAAALAQDGFPASAPMEATAAPLAETASADERARKARARREADARASALQMQQERSRTEALERQQREAEREAQQARDLADAASRRAAEQTPAPPQPAAEPRRGVRERCSASGNLFSQLMCQSRECRGAEDANDPICTRLREIEEAQRRGGQ
jgi:type IV secretory pathway VirB10-like protein